MAFSTSGGMQSSDVLKSELLIAPSGTEMCLDNAGFSISVDLCKILKQSETILSIPGSFRQASSPGFLGDANEFSGSLYIGIPTYKRIWGGRKHEKHAFLQIRPFLPQLWRPFSNVILSFQANFLIFPRDCIFNDRYHEMLSRSFPSDFQARSEVAAPKVAKMNFQDDILP